MKMLQKDRMAGEGGYAEDFQGLDNAVATQGKRVQTQAVVQGGFFNPPPHHQKKLKYVKPRLGVSTLT